MLLKIAPFSQSYDFWIAIFFCYVLAFVWLYFGYRASRSGSRVQNVHGQWIEGKGNKPIEQTGHFKMFLLHLVLGSIFFWANLWPDHHDVWFIN